MEIIVNPKFKSFIPPLSESEFNQLEENIINQGIIDPLIIWKGILVDGHNRYEIAKKHNLKFETYSLDEIENEDEILDWMDKNQIGRRNLSPDMISYIRGRMYERIKKIQGGTGVNQYKEQSGQFVHSAKTAKKIALETGVNEKTIRRDAQYFQTVEKLASHFNTPSVELIHKNIATKKDAKDLVEIVESKPELLNELSKKLNDNLFINKNTNKDIITGYKKVDIKEIKDLKLCVQDSNMYYLSPEKSELRFADKTMSLNDDKYYVIDTMGRFFHTETGIEFNLREYADVQTFPKDFKFVGNHNEIKKQIGNAVAPYMGKYISNKIKGKTVGDLFAGCGGFSCGVHQNGFETLWAIEWNEIASISYKLNFPKTKVINSDIKILNPLDFNKVDVIIGGPPCQGFSGANPQNKLVKTEDKFIHDSRNIMYKEFVRFVSILQPNYFIMENVAEISEVKNQIIEDFEKTGYSVETELVIGNDIGMKQNRKRFFFIGTKKI